MANTKIPSELIADSSITAAKLADGTITTADIADSNVTTAKIANSGVTTAKIGDAQVTTAKITDSNVTTGKIADDAVTTAKMASNSVTSDTIASGITLAGLLTVDGGIDVDNFHLDGTALALSSGDMTLDSAGDIKLDAGGSDIRLEVAGTQFGKFTRSSGDFIISASETDKDMKFAGADGSSDVTALTLDMSAAGAATFNSKVTTPQLAITSASTADTVTLTRGTNGQNNMLKFVTGSTNDWIVGERNDSSSDFRIFSYGTNANVFSLARSNGAATFAGTIASGAITATGSYSSGADGLITKFQRTGGAVAAAVTYADASTDIEFGTTTNHALSFTTNDTRRLTINNAGNAAFSNHVDLLDNMELRLGTGNDYKFDYNGSRLNIIGTGDLVADISGDFYFDADGGDLFFQDGGSAKGSISMANSDITLTASADDLILAAADNIHLICQGNESGIDITGNGGVSLYYDNDLVLQTISTGAQIGRNNDGTVRLQLYGTTGADHEIFFGNDGTNGHKDGAIRYFGEANGTTANRRAMTFSTANTEQVRIDASGNMGIHQDSPSSFNAAARDLVIGNSTGDHGISIRAATNGQSALYAVDGTGGTAGYRGRLIYDHAGDRWDIHSAAVMRMRINGTGEVHITSGGVPIDPTLKHGGTTGDVAKLRLINRSGQAANKGGALELGGVTDDGVSRSDVFASVAGLKASSGSGNREGYLQFSTNIGNALTERMRIDGGGNVIIGTSGTARRDLSSATSPTLSLEGSFPAINLRDTSGHGAFYGINGDTVYLGGHSNTDNLGFFVNGGERMRIQAGGTVLFGLTTTSGISNSTGTGNEGAFIQGDGLIVSSISNAENMILNRKTSNGVMIQFRYNGSNVGTINTNGNSLPSDRNFKRDIKDLNIGLDLITKLKPVSYNFKIDSDGTPKMFGLIAQDLEQSLEEVGVDKNSVQLLQHKPNEDEKESDYALDYLKLTPILVKAIQEQQTQIEELKKEVQELKS